MTNDYTFYTKEQKVLCTIMAPIGGWIYAYLKC